MQFDTFHAVLLTAAFIVPGFIWSSVLSMLVPRTSTAPDLRAKEFLTFSCINYGLWSWLLFPLFQVGFLGQHPYCSGFLLFVIGFVSPLALGLLTGYLRQQNTVAKFLGRFGFRTVHPIPTAWDFHFSQGQPYWVLVTLHNGSRVHGLFGLKSFAGDDPKCRDLYVEAVFRPTEQGDWAPVEDSGGVWIASDQIAVIEFRKLLELNYDGQNDSTTGPTA